MLKNLTDSLISVDDADQAPVPHEFSQRHVVSRKVFVRSIIFEFVGI